MFLALSKELNSNDKLNNNNNNTKKKSIKFILSKNDQKTVLKTDCSQIEFTYRELLNFLKIELKNKQHTQPPKNEICRKLSNHQSNWNYRKKVMLTNRRFD